MMSPPDSKLTSRGVYVEKPRFNVYTMMLMLSFVAIVIACVCLSKELQMYNWDYKAASGRTP